MLSAIFLAISWSQLNSCGIEVLFPSVPFFISESISTVEPDFTSEYPIEKNEDTEVIMQEWKEYLDGKISENDISMLLFQMSPDDIRDDRRLKDDVETRNYLISLRKYYANPGDEKKPGGIWNIFKIFTKKKDEKEIDIKKSAYDKNLNEFLRTRYAYLYMKTLDDTGGNDDEIINIYNDFFADNEKTILKWWAQRVCAIAYIRKDQKEKAADMLLELYNSLETYRRTVKRIIGGNFTDAELKGIYTNISGKEKKATLACLMRDTKLIYESDPLSARTRQIFYEKTVELGNTYIYNNLEKLLFGTEKRYNTGARASQVKDALNKELTELKLYSKKIMDVTTDEKIKLTWKLSYGFLCILSAENKEAEKYLTEYENAFKDAPPDSFMESNLKQAKILIALNALMAGSDIYNENVQDKILAALLSFDKKKFGENNYPGSGGIADVYTDLLVLTAQRYIAEGDLARATACYKDTYYEDYGNFLIDIMAGPGDMDKFLSFIRKEKPQKMDDFLVGKLKFSEDDIHYLTSMKYLRDAKFKVALGEIDKIKDGEYWATKEQFNKYGTWDSEGDSYAKFLNITFDGKNYGEMTKKEMVEKFVELDTIQKDRELTASNKMKLGCAFFYNNLVGYSDIAWKGSLIIFSHNYMWYDPAYNYYMEAWPINAAISSKETNSIMKEFFEKKHNYRRTSAKFFEEAKNATTNKEFGAACLGYILQTKPAYGEDLIKSDRFKEFKNKYNSTEFYKDFTSKCSWLSEALYPDKDKKKDLKK